MLNSKLPDAEHARLKSLQVREEKEKERLATEAKIRQERREHRRQLRLTRERIIQVKKDRNQLLRNAIQLAAQGKFCIAIDEVAEDIKFSLEQLGFCIEIQPNALEQIRTLDLFQFWAKHCLPMPDCSHGLHPLEKILRRAIEEGLDYKIEPSQTDRIIRTILEDYYLDVSEERQDRLYSKFVTLSQLKYRIEPIHHSELIFDVEKRKKFKRSRNGRRIDDAPLNLYTYLIQDTVQTVISEVDAINANYQSLAKYLTIEIERQILQYRANQTLMLWYKFPYVADLGVRNFSEALFWFANTEGQDTFRQINVEINTAIADGAMGVDICLPPEVNDKKLAAILKHFLRGKGYKVSLDQIEQTFTIAIAWD